MTDMQDKDLDGLLSLAARQPAQPTDALMNRVLADALALQPKTMAAARRPEPPQKGLFGRLAAVFGGASVMAGVFSAALAGVAFGYLDPATTDILTGGLSGGLAGTEALDLFPAADFLLTEG